MLENVSLIRRPVVELGKSVTAGFDAKDWAARLDG
jgi:arsenate reductase-like glutaredoxin family protein